jgi:predicted transcriptional regulator of viral defense system
LVYASTVAAEFNVSEDECHATLSELCDRGFIEKLVPGKFAIVNWPERDDPGEEESAS